MSKDNFFRKAANLTNDSSSPRHDETQNNIYQLTQHFNSRDLMMVGSSDQLDPNFDTKYFKKTTSARLPNLKIKAHKERGGGGQVK